GGSLPESRGHVVDQSPPAPSSGSDRNVPMVLAPWSEIQVEAGVKIRLSAQVVNDLGGDGHRECAVLFERQPGELTLAEEGIVQSRVGCADEELHGSGPVRVRRRRLWHHVQQQCSRSSLRQDLEQ